MVKNWLQKLWRRLFGRTYKLAVRHDRGAGRPIILLHGIATDYNAWKYVMGDIAKGSRVIALDLLGFGKSPKPKDINYTPEEHAKAVIATLRRLRISHDAVIVGHSMGALIAVEVVKRRPKLASQLVLVGMPVYRFDAQHRLLPNQDSVFQRIYRRMLQEKTALSVANQVKRWRPDLPGFGLDKQTIFGFKKSLEYTIMGQTTFHDIEQLSQPIELVVGWRDAFVIRRHLRALADRNQNISLTVCNGEPHEINASFARCVTEFINAAIEGRKVRPEAWGTKNRRRLPRINRKLKKTSNLLKPD